MSKIRWIEVCGFRAFGGDPQRLEFAGNLALLWAPNSQGKTSFAEALEFLLTGRTIRTEMLGGAKAEFANCLRNAHLPAGSGTYVKAGVEDSNGCTHEVERALVSDYAAPSDCSSVLKVDGATVDSLESVGIYLSDPPLRAPVLMQHTLRYAISARPQDRADFFKAMVEVQDLELFRDQIAALVDGLQSPVPGPLQLLRTCGVEQWQGDHRYECPRRRAKFELLHRHGHHALSDPPTQLHAVERYRREAPARGPVVHPPVQPGMPVQGHAGLRVELPDERLVQLHDIPAGLVRAVRPAGHRRHRRWPAHQQHVSRHGTWACGTSGQGPREYRRV